MNELRELLESICPDVDFDTKDLLIDDGVIESLDIVMIVGELNDHYGINITAADLIPENFNTLEAIWDLVEQLSN